MQNYLNREEANLSIMQDDVFIIGMINNQYEYEECLEDNIEPEFENASNDGDMYCIILRIKNNNWVYPFVRLSNYFDLNKWITSIL